MAIATGDDELGLGGVIALALRAVGVTPERVTLWLGRPCGCTERKEKLDSLYFWARRVAGGRVARAAEWLGVIMDSG